MVYDRKRIGKKESIEERKPEIKWGKEGTCACVVLRKRKQEVKKEKEREGKKQKGKVRKRKVREEKITKFRT